MSTRTNRRVGTLDLVPAAFALAGLLLLGGILLKRAGQPEAPPRFDVEGVVLPDRPPPTGGVPEKAVPVRPGPPLRPPPVG
jgi:hypothetical protein